MIQSLYPFVTFLLLVCGFAACDKCTECPADLSARFRFIDTTGVNTANIERYTDASLMNITDLSGVNYEATREAVEQDTFYVINLPVTVADDGSDTLLLSYSGDFLDSVEVQYAFSSDSRCCTNRLTVNRLNFLSLGQRRKIKSEFSIFEAFVK